MLPPDAYQQAFRQMNFIRGEVEKLKKEKFS